MSFASLASKSRRDDLFIEPAGQTFGFFLFFSGAGRRVPATRSASSAPLKNKKKDGRSGRYHKQVIPTGFQRQGVATLARTGLSALRAVQLALLTSTAVLAKDLVVTVPRPAPPITEGFKMGTAKRPDGVTLTLDSSSLLLDGKRWIPVMGEFHFSRYPESEWREELLKMKAGGVDIVASYVFWIHHEEIEGKFDWSGSRNLRRFIQLCKELDLKACVRCGPWDHGEVRNGGLPDWLLKQGCQTRTDDPAYLAKVKIFYGEIARQLEGLYWKDGGPIIGIQFENEYSGPAKHLLSLKELGRDAGMDAPLYTRTGWNQPSGNMPFGELVPLYGVYAEGFWDRSLTPMPNGYWKGFYFSTFRMDDATFAGWPGEGGTADPLDAVKYPYLTCEIGGGMMNSYHRRILVNPKDAEATTLVKLGSGSTLPGYYMYHGGVNPEGKLTTLMESQETGYWNDMPVRNYDFQAPLGQYGQIREQYHRLRRLHLFLHQWGSELAAMPAVMPEQRPHGKKDVETLRWSVRSDGSTGFIFVNNYQRLQELPPKQDVRFVVKLPSGLMTFPETPVTVPSGACFIWPFNLELAPGVRLCWATAQPLTAVDDGNVRTVFFEETEGIPAQFAFPTNVSVPGAQLSLSARAQIVTGIISGPQVAAAARSADGRLVQIVVLDSKSSLALWKGHWSGSERAFLTRAGLVIDQDKLRLTATDPADLSVAVFPAHTLLDCKGAKIGCRAEGIFERFTQSAPAAQNVAVAFEKIRSAGPLREIPLGKIQQPVAAAPLDADFEQAAVWRIKLPPNLDLSSDLLLRFHYVGDVARITLNGKLITDDFYNGNPLEIGLRRHAPEILKGDLRIAILPLRKDAPIYMADSSRPQFDTNNNLVLLRSVQLLPRCESRFTMR